LRIFAANSVVAAMLTITIIAVPFLSEGSCMGAETVAQRARAAATTHAYFSGLFCSNFSSSRPLVAELYYFCFGGSGGVYWRAGTLEFRSALERSSRSSRAWISSLSRLGCFGVLPLIFVACVG
jgi:hypothetical protein